MRRSLWVGLLTLATVVVLLSVQTGPGAAQNGEPVTISYDFSQDDGSWWTGESDNGRVWIENGALYVLNYTPAPHLQGTNTETVFTNYTLDVDSWLAGGSDDNWHYIILHYNDSNNYHKLCFSADGYISANSIINGEEIERLEIMPHSIVRQGMNAINHAHVDVNGSNISFYLNDVLLIEFDEPRLTSGQIKLGVASLGGDYSTVAFDNVVIQDRATPAPASSGKGAGSEAPPAANNTTSVPRQLTFDSAKALDPAFSPDGQRIAFYSDVDGDREIFVMNADGSNRQQLTNNTSQEYFPSWDAHGDQIVYASGQEGERNIWVMTASGSNARRLTFDDTPDNFPIWTPDGTQIIFSSDHDAGWEIYTMDNDGSNIRQLTDNTGIYDEAFDIAPNGDIVFSSSRNGSYDLYMMDADGDNVRQLTAREGDEWAASWSPDGTKLVFMSNPSDKVDLYILDVNNPELIQLTDTPFEEHYPDWSPDGGQIVYTLRNLETDTAELYIMDLPEHLRTGPAPSSPASSSDQNANLEIDPEFEALLAQLTVRGEFTTPGDDLDGYMYLTAEEQAPDVQIIQGNVFYPDSGSGRVILMLSNETGQPYETAYTLDIPKAFASHVDDLTFSQAPTQIIDPDPVVVFGLSSNKDDPMITVDSANVQANADDVQTVLHVLQGFQYERLRRHCADPRQTPYESLVCYRLAASTFPDHVSEAECDQIAQITDQLNIVTDQHYLTCRAIQTRDPWECTRIADAAQAQLCTTHLENAMKRRCEYLSGAEQAACLQQATAIMTGTADTEPAAVNTSEPSNDDETVPQAGVWRYADSDGSYPVDVSVQDEGNVIVINHQGVFSDVFQQVAPGQYHFEQAPKNDEIYGTTGTLTVVSPTRMNYQIVIGPTTIPATLTREG